MTPRELYKEAGKRGLRLEPAGDKLAVTPKGQCPPDFAAVLREHKPELLSWLEARRRNLPPDCFPWLHIAKQVLAGEFDGADGSTYESIVIGLHSISHPFCRDAVEHIRQKMNAS
jgi:hypothetical protein